MREIKFRGKRIDNGQWVYGDYFKTPLTDENSGAPSEDGWFFLTGETRHCIGRDGMAFVIDGKTLGQFTGLKDKHGKEIYEGDVLSNDSLTFGGNIVRVEWLKLFACYSFTNAHEEGNWFPNKRIDGPKIEVIGNIHENPELMEVKA